MKLRPFPWLSKKKKRHGWRQKGTRLIRVTDGFYKELRHFAKEYNLTLVAAADFMGAKAIEKVVEEIKDKQTKHQLNELMTKTLIEMSMTAKANRLAAIPSKKSPGGNPGAASPGRTPPPQP